MDDKKPLVSILVSLFNVERFLINKRLADIRSQSYKNLEIILVDDGATDNTPAIADALALEDNRIKVIHKKNGGLGSARNTGLDAAKGDYIYFCDVDDVIHSDLIEKNVSLIQEYRADLIIFGFNEIYASGRFPETRYSFKERFINSNEDLKTVFVEDLLLFPGGNGFAWNKFYRRTFIEEHHFRFGNQYIQQDEVFNMQLYPYVNRLFISSDVLYDYYVYDSGNNRSRYIPDRFEIHYSIFQRLSGITEAWSISDDRCTAYILKKFFRGINDVLLFNGFHEKNPHSLAEREEEFHEILSNRDVITCLSAVEKYSLGLEDKLYLWAYKSKNYSVLRLMRFVFHSARLIKQRLWR